MKLASTTGDFYRYTKSHADSLRLLRKAGFKYADINFGGVCADRSGVYADDYERNIEEVALVAEEVGIKMVQGHSPMGAPIALDNEQIIKDTIRCIDACGAWGIKNLVVHSGYRQGLTVEETFAENKKFFMPLLEAAEKYELNILVENFNKMEVPGLYWIDNAPDLLSMVEYVDHPLFHAIWDVGHANMQDMPQDEALRLLGSHVRALHIQDNCGDTDSHLPPFLGSLNLDAVMNGLIDIGYNGYFTFEVGAFFLPPEKRRHYARDTRLAKAPVELRLAFDKYLYEIGKCVLEAYGCFEE